MDAFAHTVAHEIKGSLSSVIGFATVLSDDREHLTVEEQQVCINSLVRGAYKLNNVVDELLLLAEMRRADVVMEPLHMASIVAQAQERLAPMICEYGAEIVAPAKTEHLRFFVAGRCSRLKRRTSRPGPLEPVPGYPS